MNQIKDKIIKKIQEKKSNLCVSLDYSKANKILEVLELVKESVVMVKIHVDIIEDFTLDFAKKLKDICDKNGIYILEDRKFADIGHIFQKKFTSGIYKIQSWCHLITMHALIGEGPIRCFQECGDLNQQGILLISQMSNDGNWLNSDYQGRSIWLARRFPSSVCGFICQNKFEDTDFLCVMPGVNRLVRKDQADQRYKTPQQAIEDGADIIIVGRGITEAHNVSIEAEFYRTLAWGEYKKQGVFRS